MHLCLVLLIVSCLFIAALWSPAGKGLTFWLLFVMFNFVFVTFPCGTLGQVWYLIVSIPDLYLLSYFAFFKNIPKEYISLCTIKPKITKDQNLTKYKHLIYGPQRDKTFFGVSDKERF